MDIKQFGLSLKRLCKSRAEAKPCLDYAEPQPKVRYNERLCKSRAEAKPCLDYAEPQPKVRYNERLCKSRAEAKPCLDYAEPQPKVRYNERLCKSRAEAKPCLDYAEPQPKVRYNELCFRGIAYLIGLLLAFESMLLFACCCVSMIYGENDLMSFIISFTVCLSASVVLLVYGRKRKSGPSRYEAYIVEP